jgi:hypothetical protein
MAVQKQNLNEHVPLPVFGAVTLALAIAIAVFGTLYWVMQPTVHPNRGLAAYHAPPGTILEPSPRKAAAQELSGVAELGSEMTASAALTPESSKEEAPKSIARSVTQKRRAIRHRPKSERTPTYSYAQEGATSARSPGAWPWF